jgi:hypothetical protein
LEVINGGAAFHENLVAKEVSNVCFLHLALRCDVYPPESRIAERAGTVKQLYPVAVKNSRVKDWTLLRSFVTDSPCLEIFERPWLKSIRSP